MSSLVTIMGTKRGGRDCGYLTRGASDLGGREKTESSFPLLPSNTLGVLACAGALAWGAYLDVWGMGL